MSLSRQQLSVYWSSSDTDHTTLRIYVSLVLGMRNNVHSVLKFIFCALRPPAYLATHAVTHFDTGVRHSSRWWKATMGYTPPLLLFQGWSQLRVSTSSQKHQMPPPWSRSHLSASSALSRKSRTEEGSTRSSPMRTCRGFRTSVCAAPRRSVSCGEN